MTSPNKVAIITGSARGIGKGCALALAEAGYNILIHDYIDDESIKKAEETVGEIKQLGVDAANFNCDISDLSTHKELFQFALDKWGRVDCLVSNAGVSVMHRGDILEVSHESFDRCIKVNTRATFFLLQECAKVFLKQPQIDTQRTIIVISSSNAEMVSIDRSEYCVSKRANSMIARLFALRLIKEKVAVFEIRPGLIMTDMTAPSKAKYDKLIAEGIVPEGRWGYPRDIGLTVKAMAEGLLPYTCALAVPIDGGMSLPNY